MTMAFGTSILVVPFRKCVYHGDCTLVHRHSPDIFNSPCQLTPDAYCTCLFIHTHSPRILCFLEFCSGQFKKTNTRCNGSIVSIGSLTRIKACFENLHQENSSCRTKRRSSFSIALTCCAIFRMAASSIMARSISANASRTCPSFRACADSVTE